MSRIEDAIDVITSQTLSSISFDDAVIKTYFFHRFASILRVPTIYLDFDLLYSGYVASGILQRDDNIEIVRTQPEHFKEAVLSTLEKISMQRHLVIFDSLNGLFTELDRKDSGRLINSVVMLLTSVGKHTNSVILIGSLSRFREGQGWVLSALGRRIIEVERMNLISVRKREQYLQLVLTDHNNATKSSIQFDPEML